MTSDDRSNPFFLFLLVRHALRQSTTSQTQPAAVHITYTTPRETIGSFHSDRTGRIAKTLLARENKQSSHMHVTTVHDRNDAMMLASPMTMPSMAKPAGSTRTTPAGLLSLRPQGWLAPCHACLPCFVVRSRAHDDATLLKVDCIQVAASSSFVRFVFWTRGQLDVLTVKIKPSLPGKDPSSSRRREGRLSARLRW